MTAVQAVSLLSFALLSLVDLRTRVVPHPGRRSSHPRAQSPGVAAARDGGSGPIGPAG